MKQNLIIWLFYMFCLFVSIISLFFAKGEKKDIVNKSYHFSFYFLVILLSLFISVTYLFYPNYINNIIGVDRSIFQTEMGLLTISISLISIFCSISDSDIDEYTTISLIWGLFFIFIGLRHCYNFFIKDYIFTFEGVGMGIPTFLSGIYLVVITMMNNHLQKCQKY